MENIDFTKDGSADPRMLPRYDSALIGILQHEGKLESFMDVFFGFLFRKTDYFKIMKTKDQSYGFPPGVAEKMLLSYFRKYQGIAMKLEKQQVVNNKSATHNKTEEQVVSTKKEEVKKVLKDTVETTTVAEQKQNTEPEVSSGEPSASSSSSSTTKTESEEAHSNNSEPVAVREENPNDQTKFQANPDSYNGAIRDKYKWSQNYDDVDVLVPVPKTVLKAKQVRVSIKKKYLKVEILKDDNNWDVAIDDTLSHDIKADDSMWSLEPGKNIEITLTKDTNYWWKALIVSEEEIDIQKIAPERSMADMDEGEMAVINKLQFDERQKRLGLPQSHELKVHDMLKKGWDAEGSPFKGQNFDPKMFNISPNAVE